MVIWTISLPSPLCLFTVRRRPHIYTIMPLISVCGCSRTACGKSCSIVSGNVSNCLYRLTVSSHELASQFGLEFFYTRKNSQTTVGPITDRPRHRPSERRNNLKGILYLHARWRLTSHKWLRMILLAPQNHPSLKESYPRYNDPAGSVCADAGLHSQVICMRIT